MFSPGTALVGIVVVLAAPCLESGHSAVPQSLMTELVPHCSAPAIHSKLAETTPSGLPHLQFIIVDSPAPTPDMTAPQAAAPGIPAVPPVAPPVTGTSVTGAQDCASHAQSDKPRLG